MKRISLWIIAATLICSASVITTSCEGLLKATVDVVEAVRATGIWEVTEASTNAAGITVGAQWTFNTDLTYSASTGESGKWMLKEYVFSIEPKGRSEFVLGRLQSVDKKNIVIELEGNGGMIKLKKIGDAPKSK